MAGKRRPEATRWFQQALHDLRAVRWNIEGGFHFYGQEVAERALTSAHNIIDAVRNFYHTRGEADIINGQPS